MPLPEDPTAWLGASFIVIPGVLVLLFFATGIIDTEAGKFETTPFYKLKMDPDEPPMYTYAPMAEGEY